MGWRNPFRIEIDPTTDVLYVADYSPDARTADPTRGPAGHSKWAIVREPGNYGWPYCATAELPYVDYDFATGVSGEPFDCANPVNDSPNNTGLTQLPAVTQPEVWYTYTASEQFPELATGGLGPMAGPVYQYSRKAAGGRNPVAWPQYYDGTPLFYEWTRDYVKAFFVDETGLSRIEPVLGSIITDNPMDLEFGPNGALYMLEYGDGFFSENPEAQLSRIDYIGRDGNHSPQPAVSAEPTTGTTPLTVAFSSEGTTDPDGDRLNYAWDFDGNGSIDSRAQNPTHTFSEDGVYRATLTVTDVRGRHRGKHASADIEVIVGNATPVVQFITPQPGDTFTFGDTVAYEVTVTDDQPVDCARVEVSYVLGHDEHGHPQSTASGCIGTLSTTVPSGHDPATDDLSGVFVAEYTDPGTDNVPPLTGSAEVVLEPTT